MTLLDQPTRATGTDDRIASARIEHPVFGHARRATVHPESMTRYRVSHGDAVIGYLEAAGPIWVALAGPFADRAVEVGQHRIFAAALRMLTDPA
ncbi:hypothetical protein [Arenivirga flava]|uniref:Uncharacterized protein n=1 Tax=Arenivirga flava TaxID=1930060 RepID=A0AA37UMV5_9MICO|nr:hypothetical protein [Arenivirga flava]GMA29322.1 hypothetical protein GCM10025874_25750 [Arenivirga flava]